MAFHAPESLRVLKCPQAPHLETTKDSGNNGMFYLPASPPKRALRLVCIISDGTDWLESGLDLPAWEHVSVSTPVRCPTWEEMCYVKGLFWDDEDSVMQLHPPRSEWVNEHQFCLHLWRPIGVDFIRPPRVTVGR